MAALKSDASIDLFTIDVGSSITTKNWPGPINMVPAFQSNSKTVTYANVPAGKLDELVTYTPFHMNVSGFEINGSNKLPQPKVTFSNMDSNFTELNIDFDDFVGFKLIRTRTYAKFLAKVDNEPTGTFNADAHFQPDIWMFNRKMEENNQFCVYELASIFDVEGIRYPRRRMYSNYCPFVFKGPDCKNNNSSFNKCGKTLAQCKERFGDAADLRFGGFPTAR